jgi:two-component system nitrate/nitrite response regulator NarL
MNRKAKSQKPVIRIVLVDSDPLRFIGLRALLESEHDFELIHASVSDIERLDNVDVIMLANRRDNNSFDEVRRLKASYPQLRIIAIGSGMSEESILAALTSGAKGYVDGGASAAEFGRAVRVVSQGSLWVPRRVLSMFVERSSGLLGRHPFSAHRGFTPREQQVLKMLLEGKSNKDISRPLGIEVRTVKAHVAKMMSKVGVRNRIALSTYAVVHSLVSSVQD